MQFVWSLSLYPARSFGARPAPPGKGKEIRSRDASASEVCLRPRRHDSFRFASGTHDPEKWCPVFGPDHAHEKREAKRRKAQVHRLRATQRSVATCLCTGAEAHPAGCARLPALHRGACRSERTPDSAQAVLHATKRLPALPAASIALKQGTLRAGRDAGGIDARTARERGYKPRPQEPHSLHPTAVTGRRPLSERDSQGLVAHIMTIVNDFATARRMS